MPVYEVEITFVYGETVYVEANSTEEAAKIVDKHKYDILDMESVWGYGEATLETADKPIADSQLKEMGEWIKSPTIFTSKSLTEYYGER